MSELKPCPFCGGEAELRYVSQLWEPKDNYWAACKCCHISGKHYPTEAEAIEAWNTRAGGHCAFAYPTDLTDGCALIPERRCEELCSVRIWQECDVWSHDLSCGHEVDTLGIEPPNYCPECGAKVVRE